MQVCIYAQRSSMNYEKQPKLEKEINKEIKRGETHKIPADTKVAGRATNRDQRVCTQPSLGRPRGPPKVPGHKPTRTSGQSISPAWLVPVPKPGLMPLPTRGKRPVLH